MRRLGMIFALLLATLAGTAATAVAQDASPEATGGALAGLGLPEVRITLENNAVTVPADVQAGQVLLTVENRLDFPAGLSLLQPPAGMSVDEMLAPPPASPAAGGSPEAGAGEMPPPWFYTATWAGGVFADPGETASVVIALSAGDWVVLSDGDIAPATLTVADGGATPGAAGMVTADATVELDNFEIRLPQQIAAGSQVWGVTNVSDQPHELFIVKTPSLLTIEQAQQVIQFDPSSGVALPPEIPDPTTFEDIGGVAPISMDQTVYAEINLEPGYYVAACFIPDRETGMPHAFMGMYVVFEIGEEGQVVSPPASPVPMEMGTPVAGS